MSHNASFFYTFSGIFGICNKSYLNFVMFKSIFHQSKLWKHIIIYQTKAQFEAQISNEFTELFKFNIRSIHYSFVVLLPM